MPTGYTRKLYDGEEQSFRDFALTCSRAIGYMFAQRDTDPDAPPRHVVPNTDYHDTGIAKARAIIANPPADLDAAADAEHAEASKAWRDDWANRARIRRSYMLMLEQVEMWDPPTPEHAGLKDFMAQQLRSSYDFETYKTPRPARLTGEEWWAERVRLAQRDIDYHTKARAVDIERAEKSNRWLDELIAGLPS